MASKMLTCILGKKGVTPYGIIRLPQTLVGGPRVTIRLKDELGTVIGLSMAHPDMALTGDAFLVTPKMAESLGLEEGFDYMIESVPEVPKTPASLTLKYNGEKPLPEAVSQRNLLFHDILSVVEARILEPGRSVLGHENNLLETTDEAYPADCGPPWLIGPQTKITLIDPRGSSDVVIAIDGPVSMKKTDMVVEDDSAPCSRADILCQAAAKFSANLSSRCQAGRVSFFILEEKATPIMFSEADQMTPWLSCGGQNPDVLSRLVNTTLSARLSSNFTSCRNLAEGLRGVIQFTRNRETPAQKPVATIILVSDGHYTEGPNPVSILKTETQGEFSSVLHVICIGKESEEPILKRCTQIGHGNFHRATNPAQLSSKICRLSERFEVVMND
jgi:hypothetical protein